MARLLRQLFRIPNKAARPTTSFQSMCTTKSLHHNYEGDGKTVVTMLNREHKHLIMINTFSDHGFRLNNGIFVVGPMAAFPRTVLQWNVETAEDITPESLSLFMLLEPKLDVFILGVGSNGQKVDPEIIKFFRSHKINTEIMPTEQACATFNFLNVERRYVGGAFIPPSAVSVYDDFVLLDTSKDERGPYLM